MHLSMLSLGAAYPGREFKVAYYSFIRVQEVYSIDVVIVVKRKNKKS